MKRSTHPVTLILLCLLAIAIQVIGQSVKSVTLLWDHSPACPNGNSNWFYRIYTADDPLLVTNAVITNAAGATVTNSWVLISTLGNWKPFTNVVATNNSVSFSVRPGFHLFYATLYDPSNFWAESLPSNPALTPEPPQSGENLRIERGP